MMSQGDGFGYSLGLAARIGSHHGGEIPRHFSCRVAVIDSSTLIRAGYVKTLQYEGSLDDLPNFRPAISQSSASLI